MQAILIVLIVLSSALCAEAKKKSKHNRMALKDDLLAYYNFEQDPRLFLIWDQSGNGNHLTPEGSPPTTTGKIGLGVSFNGLDQRLFKSTSNSISHAGGSFTATGWFKPASLIPLTTPALFGNSEWRVFLVQNGPNYHFEFVGLDESLMITSVLVEVDQWYFLAMGYDAITGVSWASVNLYNGKTTPQDTAPVPVPNDPFVIGTSPSSSYWAHGVVDECAIWIGRSLSDAELALIYNDGDGLAFTEWDKVKVCKEIKCCDD